VISTAIDMTRKSGLKKIKITTAKTKSKVRLIALEISEISDFSKVKNGIPSCGDGISQ
jgi:hypothetical protein